MKTPSLLFINGRTKRYEGGLHNNNKTKISIYLTYL